jgi:iron complex transport system ATP-binding protein
MHEPTPLLELRDVRFAYPRTGDEAVSGVTCHIQEGRWTGVVGPNGAGKSTLLRLLSGVLRPSAGGISLRGRALDEWGRRELSRDMAVVAQEPPLHVPLSVREFVELGRNPYVRPWASLAAADHEAVDAALRRTDMWALAGRQLAQLSGGEVQRAKLARALAQAPSVLLLDEPTAHLDFGHAVRFFQLLRRLVGERGWTVVCVTHDLNLASRYADSLLLLARGKLIARGAPSSVLEPDALRRTYGCQVQVEDLGQLGLLVVPVAEPVASGPGRRPEW